MASGNINAHAVAVRPASYGYGTILTGAEAEARKSTQGRRMIRERILALGKDRIYNLTGPRAHLSVTARGSGTTRKPVHLLYPFPWPR